MLDYILEDASGEASGYSYLTLTEIKDYLGVSGSGDDDLLTDMYYAVASYLEITTKQSLKDRDVTVLFDRNEKFFDLPFRPVTTITTVQYNNSDDSSGTLSETDDYKSYGLNGSRTRGVNLHIKNVRDEIEVQYNSDGSTVPYEFKMATLGWIKVLYDDERQFVVGDIGNRVIPPTETIKLVQPYMNIVI